MGAGCSRVPVTQPLASDRRAMLPFLPTLATALVIAAASLLCRPASPPETPPAAAMETARAGADGFHPAARDPASHGAVPALAAAEIVPAALAFGRLLPTAFVTGEAAKPAAPVVRPARVASQSAAPPAALLRRSCSGNAASAPALRCAEARRGEALRAASPRPVRPVPDTAPTVDAAQAVPVVPDTPEPDEGLLPKDALPYAATAASWVDGVGRFGARIGGSVGREAVAVGGSVVELFASAR